MLKLSPLTSEVAKMLPVLIEQVGCSINDVGIAGVVFGADVPLPRKLVQPFTVVITV